MASLKEIKGRISSVKSTLKITSAMKLISSAKLHKFSLQVQPLKDYCEELNNDLKELGPANGCPQPTGEAKTLVIAFSANSSLCGGYNAVIIKKAREVILPIKENCQCIFIGKKLKEAMARLGINSEKDLDCLIDHPDYKSVSKLTTEIWERFSEGEFSKVVLLYTHYITTTKQEVVYEELLPLSYDTPVEEIVSETQEERSKRIILEPGEERLRAEIQDKLLKTKVYSALMDSLLSEHAARTVAMQTATDNAQNMLDELTLEYNKGRQAKITSEILDLAGGALE